MCLSMTKQLCMLLIYSSGLVRCWTGFQLTMRCVLNVARPTFQILLIINIIKMNASQNRRKEESSVKKLQNSKQIDVLYHQFETLKSQIYGVKREGRPRPIEAHWSSKTNKEKAVGMLRESTIHKCQQELQDNLVALQASQPRAKQQLFRDSHPSESDDLVPELTHSRNQRNFSKKLQEYSQEPSINLQDSLGGSLRVEALQFAEGEEIFRQFLSSSNRRSVAELSASRREQMVEAFHAIEGGFLGVSADHLKKLGFVLETLTFMSRKLQCLELIIQEYGKVLRARSEHAAGQQQQQAHLVFSVDALERKYEAEMRKLSQFYQQELRRQTAKQPQARAAPRSDEATALEGLRAENQRLSELLRQAKELITTKEQFITSLTEENQELREELEKWKKPSLIRGSADSSLGYSVTADKHPRREASREMGHIAERLDVALGSEKREWDEFEEGSNDDINYSELDSVRDRSIDDWDISHLEMRQNSNAKSLEEDCLKVMAGKRPRNQEGAD